MCILSQLLVPDKVMIDYRFAACFFELIKTKTKHDLSFISVQSQIQATKHNIKSGWH